MAEKEIAGGSGGGGRVKSLHDLPREIPPSRDLWPGIEARLRSEMAKASADADAQFPSRAPRRKYGAGPMALGLAATIAAVAVGIWIGRSQLPLGSPAAPTAAAVPNDSPQALQIGFVSDPRYQRERAELLKSLEMRLARLPPESQVKVKESLTTIHDSMRDLETELGRDPSNALLQELLVNTYQDEMRVLATVHEAGAPGGGI